jgi:flagellar hook assembly protein FlgD
MQHDFGRLTSGDRPLKQMPYFVAVFIALCCFAAPPQANAQIVEYIIVDFPSISPDGDGVRDSSMVRISLQAPALLLTVTLEDTVTSAVLDTLLWIDDAESGLHETVWRGTDSLGTLLGEGGYRISIFATDGQAPEEYTRTVVVDLTRPFIEIDRIEPGIYTPDIEGTSDNVIIYFYINDFQQGDSVSITLTDPLGSQSRIPDDVTADGQHTVTWSGDASSPDGIYGISARAWDEAGNESDDGSSINVDTREPDIEIIDPVPELANHVSPAQLGYCFDRNGIMDPLLYWNSGEPFVPDDITWQGDTLFWSFDLRDSVQIDGVYVERGCTLQVFCDDLLGHEAEEGMIFKIDLTAPSPPVLRQPMSPVHVPEGTVSGTAAGADTVIVYRAASGDTVFVRKALLIDNFSATLDLALGVNDFWAVAADAAGNRSGHSNTVEIIYDDAAGFYYPESFRGPGSFEILSPRDALGVDIEIFTLTGERVATLEENGPATRFEIQWDLTNDDGEQVRNGPYLLVITVRYDSGKTVDKSFIAVVR